MSVKTDKLKTKDRVVTLESMESTCSNLKFNTPFEFTIGSATRPDVVYSITLNDHRDTPICQCEAQENSKHCWHKTRLAKELEIVLNFQSYVVWLIKTNQMTQVDGTMLYNYMIIAYHKEKMDKNKLLIAVIQKYRTFIYNNLLGNKEKV